MKYCNVCKKYPNAPYVFFPYCNFHDTPKRDIGMVTILRYSLLYIRKGDLFNMESFAGKSKHYIDLQFFKVDKVRVPKSEQSQGTEFYPPGNREVVIIPPYCMLQCDIVYILK